MASTTSAGMSSKEGPSGKDCDAPIRIVVVSSRVCFSCHPPPLVADRHGGPIGPTTRLVGPYMRARTFFLFFGGFPLSASLGEIAVRCIKKRR
ncbi:hypothetical protein [Pandoravirus japonicus]|uniref:Uncharacterized protein n=1 Tax=Pandoravirus japonicus TaxID=2823154 RepID=A0A811BLZ7_9VIRU|nr:hypothetical protein [Pandoravirus japonicus]